jgi:hypothetical protein
LTHPLPLSIQLHPYLVERHPKTADNKDTVDKCVARWRFKPAPNPFSGVQKNDKENR